MRKLYGFLAALLFTALLPVAARAAEGELPKLETEEHIAYIQGSGDLVRPLDPLTRAEAAQIVYSLLASPPAAEPDACFPDVPQGAWYKSVVDSLSAIGLISGYPNGNFGPLDPISRAEYVTIFTRCFEPQKLDLPFTDAQGHWAYEQLSTAVSYGWLNGYPDGTLRPDADITRAEAVAIANRVLGRTGDAQAAKAGGKLVFLDLSEGFWAYGDIMEAALPHSYEKDGDRELWKACVYPRAQRGKGYHTVDGELYYVGDDGYYVRGTKIGLLEFNASGRYVTGNSRLDALLTQVVQQQTVEGDTPYNNLRRLYNYTMNSFTYRANILLPDGASDWEAARALPMLQGHKGNCYDYAAVFTMLARKLGYQARGRSGRIRTDSWGWDEHGWVEIPTEEGPRLCDPEFQGVYVRNHGLNWDLFMKPYGSTPTRYRVAGAVLG